MNAASNCAVLAMSAYTAAAVCIVQILCGQPKVKMLDYAALYFLVVI